MGAFDFLGDMFGQSSAGPAPTPPLSETPFSITTPTQPGSQPSGAQMFGAMTGQPTRMGILGAADQEAQAELNRIMKEEQKSPQQAIQSFVSSEAGMKYFSNAYGTNPQEMFKSWTASITPPEPTQTPIAAGNSNLTTPKPLQPGQPSLVTAPQLANPGQTQIGGSVDGANGKMGATAPQMAQPGQTFVGTAQPGANPPLGAVTQQTLRPGEVPVAPGENNGVPGAQGTPAPQVLQGHPGSTNTLLQTNPDGTPKTTPLTSTSHWVKGTAILDNYDKEVGAIWVDQLTGEQKVFMGTTPYTQPGGYNPTTSGPRAGQPVDGSGQQGQSPTGAPNPNMVGQTPVGPLPGTPPPASHPTITKDQWSKTIPGAVDPNNVWDDKRNMFLGPGISPIAVSYLTGFLRQVDPSLDIGGVGARADFNRGQAAHLRQALLQIRDDKSLGANKATVESLLDLAPGDGPFTDPVSALGRGKGLLHRATQERDKAIIQTTDSRLPTEMRKEAAKLSSAWANIVDMLPSDKEMDDMLVACKAGKCGALTPRDFIQTTTQAAARAISGEPKTAATMTPEGRKKFLTDMSTMDAGTFGKIDPNQFRGDPEVLAAMRKRAEGLQAETKKATPEAPKKAPAAPPREVPAAPPVKQNENPGGFTDREGRPQRLDGSAPKAQGRVPGQVKTTPFRQSDPANFATRFDAIPSPSAEVNNRFPDEIPAGSLTRQPAPKQGPGSARYREPPPEAPNPGSYLPDSVRAPAQPWNPPKYNWPGQSQSATPFASEGAGFPMNSMGAFHGNNPMNPFAQTEAQPQTAKVSFTDQSGTLYQIHVKEGKPKKKSSKERN